MSEFGSNHSMYMHTHGHACAWLGTGWPKYNCHMIKQIAAEKLVPVTKFECANILFHSMVCVCVCATSYSHMIISATVDTMTNKQ